MDESATPATNDDVGQQLATFVLTFGPDHEDPAHPEVHTDGWAEVHAVDEEAARLLVRSVYGDRWANLREKCHWEASAPEDSRWRWYPRGCLFELTAAVTVREAA